MIEQGLVLFVGNGLASGSPPLTSVPPGQMVQLEPKDLVSSATPQAWSYHTITTKAEYVLAGQTGWTEWVVQIDCHGYRPADAINLARAIDNVLRGGFNGYFPDTDRTYIFGIFRQVPGPDGYSDANRTYVRSLEYRIIYQQV